MSGPMNPLGQKRVPQSYTGNTNNKGIASSPGMYIGVVKKNDDTQNMGRLQVWIEEFGGDPEDESTWIGVSYASPFAGTTSILDQGTNVKDYEDTIKSYGFWAVPPDLGARVLVGFAAGKLDKGFWFACLFQRGTQVSIPGIPAKNTWTGENKPAAPKNKKDSDPDLEKYVEHKPMSNALKQQGLENDPIRGTTSSGATRESPSKVLGILTPGQHQFVMDDGDKDGNNKLIRLRTTNGTQLLLDDTSGHVYIISKAGESWLELSADGRIHLYGSKDISVRTQENLNFYADKDVNIQAGRNVNIKAATDIQAQAGENLKTLAGIDTIMTSGSTSNINSSVAHYETAGVIHMNGPAASTTEALTLNPLVANQGITESICTTVPEHEPWAGHSGSINPIGPGNKQMQEDPAPGKTPRQPEPNEQGNPIAKLTPKEAPVEVSVDEATVSQTAIDKIKENNKFTPVNADDGKGQSAGFASPVAEIPSSDPNQVDPETAKLNKQNAEAEKAALATLPSRIAESVKEIKGTKILDSIQSNIPSASDIFTKGVSPDRANQMLASDLQQNENSVKKLLSGAGISKIPQNAFDSLVSYQNQTGDASYAYVKGEKIDLTSMYKNGEWDRAASFIAADERDRPRRIQEAAMMSSNNYGNVATEEYVIEAGRNQTTEMLNKGKLNQQTGNPITPQQAFAAGSSYYAQTGYKLPNLSFPTNTKIVYNLNLDTITNTSKKIIGPWPY
jgi:hypothetical protein